MSDLKKFLSDILSIKVGPFYQNVCLLNEEKLQLLTIFLSNNNSTGLVDLGCGKVFVVRL